MAQQTINTVIVLRNDQTTNWENSDHVMLPGEVGVGYLDNGNVIAKLGDGEHSWKDLPQIEGVFEEEITLTHDFGRYKINNGFVKTDDAKGMTTSQWLVHALSETKEPIITQPTFSLTASPVILGGEIGSYITKLKWTGNTTYGSYEYGPEVGLDATNRTWSISNNIDKQTSTAESGEFTLAQNDQIQLTQEDSKKYAEITGKYTLNASKAATPVNNIGVPTTGKIESTSGTIVAEIKATAYRKPFYGVLEAGKAIDVDNLTSTLVRGLPKSGTSNRSLPTKLQVPKGSEMIIFAVKAGERNVLTATDNLGMNAPVTFTKKAKAVQVEGANGFEATDYDIWYVDWNPDRITSYPGIDTAKELNLVWA